MSATCHPMSARRKASGTPACPEPITIASYFIYEGLAFVQPFKGGNSLREPGLGPCSARLQAGICSNLQCRPEGRRYKILSRIDCHTPDSDVTRAATRSPTTGLWRRPCLRHSQVSGSLSHPSAHRQSIAFSWLPERGAGHPASLVAPLRRRCSRSLPEWARPPALVRSHPLWPATAPSRARHCRG